MSAAIALWPMPRPSTTPAAIAMTFFSAPPNSTPATSSLAVQPEGRPLEPLLDASPSPRIGRGDDHRRRQAARHLRARSWDPRGRRPDGRRDLLGHHLRHAGERVVLEPFGRADEHRARRRNGRASRSTCRMPCEGTAAITMGAPSSATLERRVALDGCGDRMHRRDSAGCGASPRSRRRARDRGPRGERRGRRARSESASAVPQLPAPSTAIRSLIADAPPMRRSCR